MSSGGPAIPSYFESRRCLGCRDMKESANEAPNFCQNYVRRPHFATMTEICRAIFRTPDRSCMVPLGQRPPPPGFRSCGAFGDLATLWSAVRGRGLRGGRPSPHGPKGSAYVLVCLWSATAGPQVVVSPHLLQFRPATLLSESSGSWSFSAQLRRFRVACRLQPAAQQSARSSETSSTCSRAAWRRWRGRAAAALPPPGPRPSAMWTAVSRR